MKKILLTLTFCTIFVAWGLLSASELTDEPTVVRGERPPVSLKSLTAADYEAGKIYVKFKAEYSNLVQSGFSLDKNQYIKTGLPELDVLNQQYLASEYKQIIQTVYSSNQKSTQFKQRHQAWGFHLWFEVKLAEDAKVLEAVEAFQSNPAIELAEPLYTKVLYTQKASTENSEDLVPGMPPSNVIVDRYTPDDPYLNFQWHYNNTGENGGIAGKDISLFDAWDIEKGHNDVIVAIIDGGIQTDHEDLAGNMWSGVGYNFVDDNSTIIPHSHGTHVAGTVAAETNNTTGVAGVAGGSGSNDGVRLMSCQVFKAVEGGDMGGGFAEAMIYAADNGAAISQNSWGTRPAESYNHLVLDAIDYFNAYGGGDVLDGGITIFAAGNSNSDSIYYPAYYSGTLSVAATNNRDERSYYSNYGDYTDISAPGGEMYVGIPEGGVFSTYTGNGYTYLQGTSMACPHASGVAALIVSYAHRNGVTLKNADVYQILKETTDDHYAENPGYIGKLGTGRLNAHAALLATNNYFSPTALTPDHSFDFDGTMQGWYSVATTGHKNFVWTDQGALYGGQIESATADNGYVMLNNLYEEWMGPSPNAAALYSPIFDLTGFTNLFFSFDHKAKQIGQDYDPPFPNMSIKLEASNDGFVSNIQELWSYNFPNTAHLSIEGVQSVNISALAGSPNVQFRFNYAGGGGYWWLIDDVTINDFTPQITSLPYSETFDSNLGDCYTYSVSGDTKNWIWQDYNGNGFAKMSGYNSGETEEDWLILPEINADDYTTITMNFETAYNYGTDDANNYLKLFYSTDYSGIGNPDNTNWTELNFTQPDAGNYVYVNSGDIDLSAISGQFYLGFKYRDVGIEGNYRTWQIDNINILEVLPYYYISFEGDGETKTAYASGTVTISNVEWNLTEALIGESASDYKTGVRSVRMRGYGTSAMTMLEDKANGIGSIYFNYRRYGTDQQVDWKVEYSVDGGSNWTQIGSTFTAPASDEVQTFHEKVNMDGNVRIRIKRATETGSTNRRLNIDDMLITDYNKVTFLADMSLAEGFDAETDVVYLSGN
ncbi:MAG: S8 family serine peptidase, partial [Bacteroidales bacterium]|nr:S8 family serine peptidase [Bacteroidales bacterium]